MPPPRRAKIEISEAPKARAVSAVTTSRSLGAGPGAGQVPEQAGDREQGEAGDQQAGDGAGAEGDGQAALQAGAGGFGGADVGPDRDVHADEAGGARQQRADDEGDRAKPAEEDEDQRRRR